MTLSDVEILAIHLEYKISPSIPRIIKEYRIHLMMWSGGKRLVGVCPQQSVRNAQKYDRLSLLTNVSFMSCMVPQPAQVPAIIIFNKSLDIVTNGNLNRNPRVSGIRISQPQKRFSKTAQKQNDLKQNESRKWLKRQPGKMDAGSGGIVDYYSCTTLFTIVFY